MLDLWRSPGHGNHGNHGRLGRVSKQGMPKKIESKPVDGPAKSPVNRWLIHVYPIILLGVQPSKIGGAGVRWPILAVSKPKTVRMERVPQDTLDTLTEYGET